MDDLVVVLSDDSEDDITFQEIPMGPLIFEARGPVAAVPTVAPHDDWDDLSPAELAATIRAVPYPRGAPTRGQGRHLRPTGPIVTEQGIQVFQPSTGQYVPWQRHFE